MGIVRFSRSIPLVTTFLAPFAIVFPLDVLPAAAVAYSFRRLRTSYSGSAVRIRRSSDNAEADIGFDANGDFDTAAAAAHIGGGSGFGVTWYDQSGNGDDVTQSTANKQPAYQETGLNSLPTFFFTSAEAADSDIFLSGTDAVAFDGALASVFAVASLNTPTGGGATANRLLSFRGTGQSNDSGNNSSFRFGPIGASNEIIMDSNGDNAFSGIPNNTPKRLGGTAEVGALRVWEEGVNTNTDSSIAAKDFGNTSASIAIGGRHDNTAVNNWHGPISEVILWNVLLSGGEIATIDADQASKWGF
jgi:hypothetical protein